jgi:hypothetical protein
MKIFLRAIAAIVMLASLTGFAYCLYELLKTGSCSSGGPYVTTLPECPPGTAAWVWIMQGAILVGVCDLLWFILLNRRWAARLVRLPAPVLPDSHGTGPYRSGTMDARAAGALRTLLFPPGATDGEPQDRAPAGDALARLERLQVLRSSGILTPAEFEKAKAKIMEEF